jgi:MinD-like ATPase involved in chromosome partitioning or flagellar assembly
MEGKPGASDLLAAGSLGSGDPTVESSHENLRFLPAGTKSGVLLGDYPLPAIESLASALRGTAQLVILQTSPVDVYSDASALAKYVDEAVIVVSATRSSFRDLPPALEILRLAGAQNISFVLTDASTSEEAFAGVSSGSAIVPTEGRAA